MAIADGPARATFRATFPAQVQLRKAGDEAGRQQERTAVLVAEKKALEEAARRAADERGAAEAHTKYLETRCEALTAEDPGSRRCPRPGPAGGGCNPATAPKPRAARVCMPAVEPHA